MQHDTQKTLLVVDDEPGVLSVLAMILTRAGYTVLTATCGQQALDLSHAHGEPIHLLVTDILLPGMSGPQLAARLLNARPEMRVLCIGGMAATEAVQYAVAQGYAFLPKPFHPHELKSKVAEALAGKGAASSAASA
jgi:two-component system, cell cycle sensor histidine kinase and response regulator CckA